jgi:hypothetical protein
MKCLIGLPSLIHIELLWRSRSFKNQWVKVGAFVYRLHSPGSFTGLKRSKLHRTKSRLWDGQSINSHLSSWIALWVACPAWLLTLLWKSSSPVLSSLGYSLWIESQHVHRSVHYGGIDSFSGLLEVDKQYILRVPKNRRRNFACWWQNFKRFGYRWTRMLPLHGCTFWFRLEVIKAWLITGNTLVECVLSFSRTATKMLQVKSHLDNLLLTIQFSGAYLVQMHLVYKCCAACICGLLVSVYMYIANKFECIQKLGLGCGCFQNYATPQHVTPPHHTTLCCTAPHCSTLHHHTPQYITLHHTTLYHVTPHGTSIHHTIPHHIVPRDTTLHPLSSWP